MNPDALPAVALVVGMFVTFIVVLGGVHIWTNLPPKR